MWRWVIRYFEVTTSSQKGPTITIITVNVIFIVFWNLRIWELIDNEFIIERNMIYKSLTLEHVLDFNNKKIIIQWMFDTFAHNLVNSWFNEFYSELPSTGI